MATRAEVDAKRVELRRLLIAHGLARPRLRTDGAVVVTSAGRNVAQATIPAEELVGAHVRLSVDSAPGAFGDGNLQAL